MKIKEIALVSLAMSAVGCATMNPYLQHNQNVSESSLDSCSPVSKSDAALKYACQMSIRLEQARAQIVGTRSGLTATIFPLVGVIGYNSARGINAPTNAAMTTGGFAGYSAISTLAQPDRIRVYDSGLKSIQCAIGVYEVVAAQARPNSVEREKILLEALWLEEELQNQGATLHEGSQALREIKQAQALVEAVASSAKNHQSPQEAQLVRFVRNTVAKVNMQITSTVPSNEQLAGNALGVLQMSQVPAQGGLSAIGNSRESLTTLAPDIEKLIERYDQFIESERQKSAAINFDECNFADVSDVGFNGAIIPMRIGPNNIYSGATVDVASGSSFSAVLSGGVPPYTATVVKTTGAGAISANIKAADGLARLEISVTNGTRASSHTVVVSDATNQQSSWLIVKVPE